MTFLALKILKIYLQVYFRFSVWSKTIQAKFKVKLFL